MFHSVGTCATAGLTAGWEVGRVVVVRSRGRVDPGKKAAAEGAVRAACGVTRAFYDGNACPGFVTRLAEKLLKQRDPSRRNVKERAEQGLAAVSRGAVENKDGLVCLTAACRSECGQFPCAMSRVLRARAAQSALAELGGSGVTVGGTTVAMPSGGVFAAGKGRGGGKGGGGPAARLPGKSSRAERDVAAPPLGGFGVSDFSGAPLGMSVAARKAEAAAAVNTKAAVARLSAQVSGFHQQGWEHMSKAEADEVTAALGHCLSRRAAVRR